MTIKTQTHWKQLKIDCLRDDSDLIETALLDSGALSVTLEDAADQPILEPGVGETPLWDRCIVTGLFDAHLDCAQIESQVRRQLPNAAAHWLPIAERDWCNEWKKDFHPVRCGERLWVCPSWTPPTQPDAVNVILDPGLAFGTGSHPTTFLCLQWLDQQPLGGKTVIDFGCGSGILGIAAVLLGARKVFAVDNDPQALLATRDNAERNAISASQIDCLLPSNLPEDLDGEFMLANILAAPLIQLAPQLSAMTQPGGQICLSGILATQIDAVCAPYNEHFQFDPPIISSGWAQLGAKKIPS